MSLQQQEEGGEAEEPGDELDGEDLAEVAPAVAQDRQALAHALPDKVEADYRRGDMLGKRRRSISCLTRTVRP